MTEGNHDDLLQRALDGTLDERGAARLAELMRNDAALQARAEQLRRLVALIEDQEPAQPPATFVNDVMDRLPAEPRQRPGWIRRRATETATVARRLFKGSLHQSGQGETSAESPWITRWTGGGAIVAKKALWAVACLALVVIVAVVYYNGTRSVNGGAESTIGAADRYRGAQPTAADVKAEQAAAQQFLQTDLFDRMIKDRNVRNLLSDRNACAVIARIAQAGGDAEAWAGVRNASKAFAQAPDEVYAALRNVNARAGIAEFQETAALKNNAAQVFFGDGEAVALWNKARAAVGGDGDAFAELVVSKQKAVKVANGDAEAALSALRKNAKFAAMIAGDSTEVANLARRRKAMEALEDPAFVNMLSKQTAVAWMNDESVANLVKAHAQFLKVFDNAEAAILFRDVRFMDALAANGDLAQAMGIKGFAAALTNQTMLAARLKTVSE